MHADSVIAPFGDLGLRLVTGGMSVEEAIAEHLAPTPLRPLKAREILTHALPQRSLPDEVNLWRFRNQRHFHRGFKRVMAARALRLPTMYGQLRLALLRGNGDVLDLGIASMRVVTTAGVNFIVDAFQNSVELENLKYHGFGTGGSAEATGNTALTTELTTEYVSNNTRPTGTTTEGASANIYRTVATLSPDSGGTLAITEHGVFDQASNAGGTLLDRTLFSAVNVVASSDSLQATYELTLTAGS